MGRLTAAFVQLAVFSVGVLISWGCAAIVHYNFM